MIGTEKIVEKLISDVERGRIKTISEFNQEKRTLIESMIPILTVLLDCEIEKHMLRIINKDYLEDNIENWFRGFFVCACCGVWTYEPDWGWEINNNTICSTCHDKHYELCLSCMDSVPKTKILNGLCNTCQKDLVKGGNSL